MADILFLGTGAADWDINEKNSFTRRFSASLVNCELLIDCNPHIFHFAESVNNKELFDTVTDILITHNHGDHFSRDAVRRIADSHKIRVGCGGNIASLIGEHPNIEFTVLQPYKAVTVGKYQVLPVLANHDVVIDGDACAFHYIITTPDNKTLFYGLDGAWLLRPTWQEMLKRKFDLMIFDCTVGDSNDWRLFEHNTIPMLRVMLEEIKNKELLNEGGKLVASHLARTLHAPLEETVKILEKIDMITAYDGMKISF